jgi:hypothetical protein
MFISRSSNFPDSCSWLRRWSETAVNSTESTAATSYCKLWSYKARTDASQAERRGGERARAANNPSTKTYPLGLCCTTLVHTAGEAGALGIHKTLGGGLQQQQHSQKLTDRPERRAARLDQDHGWQVHST